MVKIFAISCLVAGLTSSFAYAEKKDSEGVWQGDFAYSAVTSFDFRFCQFKYNDASNWVTGNGHERVRAMHFADVAEDNPNELRIVVEFGGDPNSAFPVHMPDASPAATPDHDRFWSFVGGGYAPTDFGWVVLRYDLKTKDLRFDYVASDVIFKQTLSQKTSTWYTSDTKDQNCKIKLEKEDFKISGRTVTLDKLACDGEVKMHYVFELEKVWDTKTVLELKSDY